MYGRERMAALAAVVLLLGLSTALAGAGVTSQDYRRPPASPFLPIDHERLARDVGAGPHVPEQVHLTLAGPGAMAVSWLTYPQVCTFEAVKYLGLSERSMKFADVKAQAAAVTGFFVSHLPCADSPSDQWCTVVTSGLCLLHRCSLACLCSIRTDNNVSI